MKYRVKLLPFNIEFYAKEGDILAYKMKEKGIPISMYCNGKGICGKCLIKIIEGNKGELVPYEKEFLKNKNLPFNYRFACQVRVQSDLTVEVPESSLLEETEVLQTGVHRKVVINSAIKKYIFTIQSSSIAKPYSCLELIKKFLNQTKIFVNLSLLKSLPRIFQSHKSVSLIVYDNKEILDILPEDKIKHNIGIALDIGTSTLVMEMLDLETGQSLGQVFQKNPQTEFGGDVISRITFSCTQYYCEYFK